MTYLRDLVSGDDLSLFLAIFGLFYVGRLFVRDRPRFQRWGVRLAAAAFLAAAAMRLLESSRPMGDDLLAALLFGAIAAGLFLGPTWIVIGTICFFADQLRLVRAAAVSRIDQRRHAWNERRQQAEMKRQQREQQLQERRLAPVRQRQRQQELERQREWDQQQKLREQEKHQRDSRRLEAELQLEFALDTEHRERIQGLIDRYADQELPIEEYRHRLEVIQRSVTRNTNRSRSYQSVAEIVDEFDDRLADLDQMALEREEKESLRALLMMERQQAIERFMQR